MPLKSTTVTAAKDIVVVETPEDFSGAIEALRAGKSISVPDSGDDTAELQQQILDRILSADSLEGLYNSVGALLKTDAVLGHTLEIHGAHMRPSDFADGVGVFLVIEATDEETGEFVQFGCGGRAVVAWLLRAAQLVRDGVITEPPRVVLERAAKPTKAGYYPLNIVRAPERVVLDDGTSF